MEIVWTLHAEQRQQQWEERLGITKQEIESVLLAPEQSVPDEEDVFVAQSRRGDGLLRVVYAEVGATYRILTVYWTNQINRYWQGESE
ncbi:hypothetical protein LEP3755_38370 [Leptolyngbya sp. NIES-3755]|nr:hypothetical protein LEP3755_38370 [Leptolyngbya sp. NIES-3755]